MNDLLNKLRKWNIEYDLNDTEKIELVISDNGYINYIDDESIFFNGIYEEKIRFGQIIKEYANLTFTLTKKNPLKIVSLFDKYKDKYQYPSLDFLKEMYTDFRDLGCTDVVTRSVIIDFLCNFNIDNTFSNFNCYDFFNTLVCCVDLLNLSIDKHYIPVPFKTSFATINGNWVMYHSDFDTMSLQYLDIYNSYQNNISFCRCSNCKDFFIKHHMNNTKFCPNCRKKSIESVTDDEFYKLYRKKYKTMKQRENRSDNPYRYSIDYTLPWIDDVTEKMNLYKTQNDLDAFTIYINKAMNKHKPKMKGSD